MPAGFHAAGMFRPRLRRVGEGWIPRCQMPSTLYALERHVVASLGEATRFIRALVHEMDEMFSDVAANKDMRRLLDDSAQCWNWNRLALHRPSADHVAAFHRVATALRPRLVHTLYPSPSAFAAVPREWPQADALARQYMLLCARVRRAAAAAKNPVSAQFWTAAVRVPDDVVARARRWIRVVEVDAFPAYVFSEVQAILGKALARAARHAGAAADLASGRMIFMSSLVSRCLGSFGKCHLPAGAYAILRVAPRELKHLRGAQSVHANREVSDADRLDVLAFRRREGGAHRIIIVRRVIREIDLTAVSSSILRSSWFVLGSLQQACDNTFGAARVLLRCICLFPPETPCERIGSFMRLLWRDREHMAPAALIDKVMLGQARVLCVGAPRDEHIVDAVVRYFRAMRKTRPHVMHSRVPRVLREHEDWLRNSGRAYSAELLENAEDVLEPEALTEMRGAGFPAHREFFRARRRNSVAAELPPSLHKALLSAARKDFVHALPLDIGAWRASDRGATRRCWHGFVDTSLRACLN